MSLVINTDIYQKSSIIGLNVTFLSESIRSEMAIEFVKETADN